MPVPSKWPLATCLSVFIQSHLRSLAFFTQKHLHRRGKKAWLTLSYTIKCLKICHLLDVSVILPCLTAAPVYSGCTFTKHRLSNWKKMAICITHAHSPLLPSPPSPLSLVLFGSIRSWRSSFWHPQTPSSAIINTQVARHRTMQPAATTGSDHHLPSSR